MRVLCCIYSRGFEGCWCTGRVTVVGIMSTAVACMGAASVHCANGMQVACHAGD